MKATVSPMRARPRHLVDERDAACPQPIEHGLDVLHEQREVMDARAAPGMNRAIGEVSDVASSNSREDCPTGTNVARTCSLGTSCGVETSRPSASR